MGWAERAISTMTIIRPRHAVAFADLFALLFLMLVLLPHNPDKASDSNMLPPGSIIVEVRWADSIDVDIDTWVMAPGQPAVGYSNPSGTVFNLLRDDVGLRNDPLLLNYENVYSRGVPSGDYTVNLFYYRGLVKNVKVSVVVWLKKKGLSPIIIAKHDVIMEDAGHELTIVRFSVAGSSIIPGSVHRLTKSIAPMATRGEDG